MAKAQTSITDTMPGYDMVHTEFDKLKNYKTGEGQERFNWNPVSTTEMDELVNEGISFCVHEASMHEAMSAFFARDNVGLPGIAMHCKVHALNCRNMAWKHVDFQNKRAAAAKFPAVGMPPSEFCSDEMSDVAYVFTKMLAMAKVAYVHANSGFKLATKNGDGHAADFFGNIARGLSDKMRIMAIHLSNLKICGKDKLAIKEFDRMLQREMVPMEMAVGLESTLPNSQVLGGVERVKSIYSDILHEHTFIGEKAHQALKTHAHCVV